MTAPITGMAHVGDVEEGWIRPAEPFLEDAPFGFLWLSGDSFIKTMYRAKATPRRTPESIEAHKHEGQLWERVRESGARYIDIADAIRAEKGDDQ